MVPLTPSLHALNTHALGPPRPPTPAATGVAPDEQTPPYDGEPWTLTFKERSRPGGKGTVRAITISMAGGSRDGRHRDLSLALDQSFVPIFEEYGWTVKKRNKWYVTCTDHDRNACEWEFQLPISKAPEPGETYIPHGSTEYFLFNAFGAPTKTVVGKRVYRTNLVLLDRRAFLWSRKPAVTPIEGQMVEWMLGAPEAPPEEQGFLTGALGALRDATGL